MPIHEVEKKTVVQFGTGDVSITHIKDAQMNRPVGLHLSNLAASHHVGEQIKLEMAEDTKEVLFRFERLASLDLLISQLKLLRGSLSDGELLVRQPLLITEGKFAGKQGVFSRLYDGDTTNCLVIIDGSYARLPHTAFRFSQPGIQQYFDMFFSVAQ